MALAPAKLNLYLDVLGRRPDAYHDIESLFVALDWGDEVGVLPRRMPGVTLGVEGDVAVPMGPENLAVKAATAWLEAQAGDSPFAGVGLTLVKRIPVGGGLGGGSSDGAAVLRALEALVPVGVRLGERRLEAAARGLGADVPFFLLVGEQGGAAVGRGRGDTLEPLPPPPPLSFVLVTPPWGHATADVFAHSLKRLRPPRGESLAGAQSALASGVPARVREAHWNALALPAMRAYPAFTRFTSDVERRLGRPPCLSGTGSTLYDVADDADEAEATARRLEGMGARVVVARCG